MAKRVKIIPDVSIFKRLSRTNMPPAGAIAELVDNSIDSFIINRKALGKLGVTRAIVQISFDVDGDEIIVADNCAGMDEEALVDSFKLGRSGKGKFELGMGLIGKYGLGVKTASMVLGNAFTICTKQPDAKKALSLTLDADKLEKSDWELDPVQEVSVKFPHGTEVSIYKLHKRYSAPTLGNIKDRCSRIFTHYIQSGALQILINGEPVSPFHQPELRAGSHREFEIRLKQGPIKGWVALMTKSMTSNGNYGFNLVRNSRVVEEYKKIGINAGNWESRIVGELHLDGWEVDFTKAKVPEDLPGFDELAKKLREELQPEIADNKRSANPGKFKGEDNTVHSTMDNIDRLVSSLPKEIARTLTSLVADDDQNGKESDPDDIRNELEQLLRTHNVLISVTGLGKNAPLVHVVKDPGGELRLTINLDRPFVGSLDERARKMFSYFVAAQAVAEQGMDKESVERLRSMQNAFLSIAEKEAARA